MKVTVATPTAFFCFDLARELARRGHLAQLVTAYPRRSLPAELQGAASTAPWLLAPGYALRRLGLPRAAERINPAFVVAFDAFASSRVRSCDVFHCMSSFGLRAHEAVRRRFGAVTVCDRASSHARYQRRVLLEEFDRWGLPAPHFDARVIERELAEYELCDLIVVASEFVRESFIREGVSPEKIAKVPYGVDLTMFQPLPKTDDVFRVLHAGALSVRKGIPDLLEAVGALRLPRFELCLAGPQLPEVAPFLRRYDGRFRYLGVYPRQRLREVYSQASVLVLASVEEGLALVQAQAMACGIPVIATTNTGAADLFTDGVEGFVVPSRSPDAIRDRVLCLYRDPELRAAMSAAALARVRSLAGWAAYGDGMTEAYRRALEDRVRH